MLPVDKVKLAECVRANGQLTQQRLMLEEEAKKLSAGRPKRKDDMEKMQGKIVSGCGLFHLYLTTD